MGTIAAQTWSPTDDELAWYTAQGLLTTTGDPADPVYLFRCVRSGNCCRTNLCDLGVTDAATGQCQYLETAATLEDGSTLYQCTYPKDEAEPARQIGKGCCFPWGSERLALIDRYRKGANRLIPTIELL